MKKFLINIFKYSFLSLVILEIIIRLMGLTNDVPQRDVDKNGLQVFKKNQEGISHGEKWKVNSSGFLGHDDINGENQLLIIGDSVIENIMNPFRCRQSSIFKNKGYDVFEIGRSGVTFIEALEFYSKYKSIVKPKKTIFFIDKSDFLESIREITVFNDRTQISLENSLIYFGKIKARYLKMILYNYKTLYFVYLGYLKSIQLKKNKHNTNNHLDNSENLIIKLIEYSVKNYDLKNCLFVFRGVNDFRNEFLKLNIKFIELNLKGKEFTVSEKDLHWNCKGHKKASELILENL